MSESLSVGCPNGVGANTLDLSFDEEGNIVYKSNVGDYTYLGNSNLLASAGYRSYEYDANGNMVKGNGMTIEWTSFNKPSKIVKNGITTTFQYDANHNRIVQTRMDGMDTIQRVYIGNYEEVIVNGKVKEWLHYIFAGDKRVALFTVKDDMTVDIKYLHTDNLGSIRTITGPDGNVLQRLDYDPYGRKISVKTNQYTLQELEQNSLITPRGYTGHEHLEESDLIHMNARLYDPIVGRFISPDSIIPDEYDLNGMNRLSYVRNNPLIHIDPTGNSWLSNKLKKAKKKLKKLSASLGSTINATMNSVTNIVGDFSKGISSTFTFSSYILRDSVGFVDHSMGEIFKAGAQVVDYCKTDPLSCALFAATFTPYGQTYYLLVAAASYKHNIDKCTENYDGHKRENCHKNAAYFAAVGLVGHEQKWLEKIGDILGL